MDAIITELVQKFERGALTRRQLIQGLSALVAAGPASAQGAAQNRAGLQATGINHTSVRLIVRDFMTPALQDKERLLATLAERAASRFPGVRTDLAIQEQYRNMREVLDGHPQVVDCAREAMRRAGMTVRERPIRGGTDGSRLSFMGLPTPNIFAGEQNFHSRQEWISVQDMDKAVEVIVTLAQVWADHARPRPAPDER